MEEHSVDKPVVIILDMAKGYGWLPGTFGYEMVARVRRLKDLAYQAGVQVIHVNSMRRPTDNLGGDAGTRMGPGSEGVEVIAELQPVTRDILIYKRYLSGFSHNDLDYTLRAMGCDCIIVAGASTDNTVLWTCADGYQNRYHVVALSDCTMVHRENADPDAQRAVMRIIKDVLRGSEVLSLDEAATKYLTPSVIAL